MRNYNFIHAIFLSFYSGDFYRQVAQRWRGRAFAYLWILLAIVGIPLSYHAAYEAIWRVQQIYVPQIPTITIKQGVASTDQVDPVFIKDAIGETMVIIDTQNQFQNFKSSEAQVLVQNNQIVYKTAKNQLRTEKFSEKDSFVIDKQTINHFTDKLIILFAIVFYLMLITFGYIVYIVFALIYGVFGLVFAKTMKCKMAYPATLALSLVVVTPALIIASVLKLLNISFGHQLLVLAILYLLYLFVAVRANCQIVATSAPN